MESLKKLIVIFLLLLTFSANAQSIRLLSNFDAIPLGSKKFEIEGFMSTFSGFKQSKVNSTFGSPDKRYTGIEYVAENNDEIILLFFDGTLYLKRLILDYPLKDLRIAKEEYGNLKDYILTHSVTVKQKEDVLSNNAYGSEIGERQTFYMNNSTKQFKTKTATFIGKLDFNYDTPKTTAKIIGYNLEYQCIDLSKTSLDSKTGFSFY